MLTPYINYNTGISGRSKVFATLRWRHHGRDSVSNHQPYDCLLKRLFRRRSKNTSKLRVTGLCAGNSPGTGEFPAHMASNAEDVSIWWRHHDIIILPVNGWAQTTKDIKPLSHWIDLVYPEYSNVSTSHFDSYEITERVNSFGSDTLAYILFHVDME